MKLISSSFLLHFNSDFRLISWLFLRGLALIYFAAFASMSEQIEGLVGENGLLPLINNLALIDQLYPGQRFSLSPSVFWFNASDQMLKLVCYFGMAVACLLLVNIFSRISLIACYLLYLSIVEAGQEFTHFQWDVLLLEVGFLAIFLTWGSGIIILLFRWLLARFMFMGGLVKVMSSDPAWANLTALNYHYETQPLPTPIAYYFHHLPIWFNKLCVGGVLLIELVLPFFIFLPRRFRIFAGFAFIFFQSTIILTGNYTFFNLLSILLCLFLFEDKHVATLFPGNYSSLILEKSINPGKKATYIAGFWASVVLVICGSQIWIYHVRYPAFDTLQNLLRTTSAYSLVNNYGPFAVMTTERNEIIIEGSNDNKHWSAYEFIHKPGDLKRQLSWVVPHQPRLDWQMWFAALRPPTQGSWFNNLIVRLLEGSPAVLSLLATNPFPDQPPLYIRALKYKYSYSSLQQRQYTGAIWLRRSPRIYWPVTNLKTLP